MDAAGYLNGLEGGDLDKNCFLAQERGGGVEPRNSIMPGSLTLRWPRVGGGVDATPQQVFPIFLRNGKSFIQKWEELILGASVHEKIFQIGPTVLALKLDKGRVLAGGVATTPPPSPIEQKLTYFSSYEDDIQS